MEAKPTPFSSSLQNINSSKPQDKKINLTRLETLSKMFKDSLPSIVKAKGQNLVYIIGRTKAGKSTITNYFLGHSFKKVENEIKGGKRAILIEQAPVQTRMGDGTESETLYPQLIEETAAGLVYCDTGGFGDNRGECIEFVIKVNIHLALKAAKRLQAVVVVFEKSTLYSEGANHFGTLLKDIKELFLLKSDADVEIYSSFIFIMNKKSSRDTKNKVINQIQSVIDIEVGKLKRLETLGSDAGKEQEAQSYRQTIALLTFIKDNPERLFLIDVFDRGQSRTAIIDTVKALKPVTLRRFVFGNKNTLDIEFKELVDHVRQEIRLFHDTKSTKLTELNRLKNDLENSKINYEAYKQSNYVEVLKNLKAALEESKVLINESKKIKKVIELKKNQLNADTTAVVYWQDDCQVVSAKTFWLRLGAGGAWLGGGAACVAGSAVTFFGTGGSGTLPALSLLSIGVYGAGRGLKTTIKALSLQTSYVFSYNKIPFLYYQVKHSNGILDEQVTQNETGEYRAKFKASGSLTGKCDIKIYVKKCLVPKNRLKIEFLEKQLEGANKAKNEAKKLRDRLLTEISLLEDAIKDDGTAGNNVKAIIELKKKKEEIKTKEQEINEKQNEYKKIEEEEKIRHPLKVVFKEIIDITGYYDNNEKDKKQFLFSENGQAAFFQPSSTEPSRDTFSSSTTQKFSGPGTED